MMDNLHFIFLQLPFFTKKIDELETKFDKWCYFLKNLETMDAIPAILNEPVFQKAFEVATVNNMDKNDYILYQISKSKKYDMEIFGQESEERGIQIGLERGKAEAILSIHGSGYSASEISNLLKMPMEDVIKVLQNHGFTITD